MSKKYFIFIAVLLFLFSFGFADAADYSCDSLNEQYGDKIKEYDQDNNNHITLEESIIALKHYLSQDLAEEYLLAVIRFDKNDCVIPSKENDPVSGTLSVNKTQFVVGETIELTVTGQDNDGLSYLWAYYQGAWHKDYADGTEFTSKFTFSESKPGTYVYKGYVYGKEPRGLKETTWTEPKSVTVNVVREIACTDTDGGKDYYVKGTVKLNGETETDYCIESGSGEKYMLMEYYCRNSNIAHLDYKCPYGCENGACKPGIRVISPNGGEEWEGGDTLEYKGGTYDIKWKSEGVANVNIVLVSGSIEWRVAYNIPASEEKYSWTIGDVGVFDDYKIKISDSVQPFINDESDDYFSILSPWVDCTDSDGGKDYYVKGYCTVPDGSLEWDHCQTEFNAPNDVSEHFCDVDNKCYETSFTCPYGCEDGACLREVEKPDLTITRAEISDNNGKLYYTVKNQGDALAPTSESFFTVDGERGGTSHISSMSPGSSQTFHFDNWECGVPGKSYRIGICVDWDHQISESNEDNNCHNETLICQSEQNDPVSGTLSVNKTQFVVGETIELTVTGQDDDGIKYLWAYYQGAWHKDYADGTKFTSKFTFSESKPDTYIYKGYVYGKEPDGSKDSGWTEPPSVRVTVVEQTQNCEYLYWFDNDHFTCGYKQFCGVYIYSGLQTFETINACEETLSEQVVDCSSYGSQYWCSSYNGWALECQGQGKIIPLGNKFCYSGSNQHNYCATCQKPEDNHTLTGGLSTNKTRVSVGESFQLTISAQDGDGVKMLKAAWDDRWHTSYCDGDSTSCTKTYNLEENNPGDYYYHGYVFGLLPDGQIENAWTSPRFVKVTVGETVKKGADLVISSVSVKPSSPDTNDEISFDVTIKNIGDERMLYVNGGIITRVSSNSLPGTGYRIGSAMIKRLNPGESDTIDCPIVQTLSSGTHSFTFLVDSSNRLSETNERNNGKIKTFSVASSGGSTVACTDSDGGKDYYVRGKATGLYSDEKVTGSIWGEDATNCSMREDNSLHYSIFYDCCSSPGSKQLNEAYCDENGIMQSVGYQCPNGCENGACIKEETTCTDSDGGANYYQYGSAESTTNDVEGRVDCCKLYYSTNMGDSVEHIGSGGGACVTSGPYLYEAICENNIPYVMVYQCPNGCENGVCIQ